MPSGEKDVIDDTSCSDTESDASDLTVPDGSGGSVSGSVPGGSITTASDDYSPTDSKGSAGANVWVAETSDSEDQHNWSPDSDGLDGANDAVLMFGFDMDAYPPFEQLDPNMLSFVSAFKASKVVDSNANDDSDSRSDATLALNVLERFPVSDILFAPRVEDFQGALLRALLLPLRDRLHCRCLDLYWKLFREVCLCMHDMCKPATLRPHSCFAQAQETNPGKCGELYALFAQGLASLFGPAGTVSAHAAFHPWVLQLFRVVVQMAVCDDRSHIPHGSLARE